MKMVAHTYDCGDLIDSLKMIAQLKRGDHV